METRLSRTGSKPSQKKSSQEESRLRESREGASAKNCNSISASPSASAGKSQKPSAGKGAGGISQQLRGFLHHYHHQEAGGRSPFDRKGKSLPSPAQEESPIHKPVQAHGRKRSRKAPVSPGRFGVQKSRFRFRDRDRANASSSPRKEDKASKMNPEQQQDDKASDKKKKKRDQAESGPSDNGGNGEGRRGSFPSDDHDDQEDHGSGSMSRFSDLALQGLLRKLGAGLEDLLPMSSFGHSRMKTILSGLKAEGDEGRQLESLTELCETLSVSSEEALITFNVEAFVPALVNLLAVEHNPDVALLAARALTHLADLMPPSCASMVRHGAVPLLCGKLLAVEYIDLAEQSLQCLEKMSKERENAGACLRSGGVVACLSFIDFFQSGVQRVAVRTAANMCRAVKPDCLPHVEESMQILLNLLSYGDSKVVENAFLALARIIGGLCKTTAGSREVNKERIRSKVIPVLGDVVKLMQVTEGGALSCSGMSLPSYYEAVQILSSSASKLPAIAETLLELELPQTLNKLLATSPLVSLPSSPASPGASALRSVESTLQVLKLINSLLPTLPDISRITDAQEISKLLAFGDDSNDTVMEGEGKADTFESMLSRRPELLENAASVLLPTLLGMVGSTLASRLKHLCLSAVKKTLLFTPKEPLRRILASLGVSSSIASLLSNSGGDPGAALDGLFMAEILMEKLPETFMQQFMKEGVLYSINEIASSDGVDEQAPNSATTSNEGGEGRRKRASTGSSGADQSQQGASLTVTPQARVRSTLLRYARLFQSTHLGSGSDPSNPSAVSLSDAAMRENLESLLRLAKNIASGDQDALQDLLNKLSGKDDEHGSGSISAFELLHGGLEKALLRFLCAEGSGAIAQERMRMFTSALASTSKPQEVMATLLRRLHEALASVEKFGVITCPTPMRQLLFSDRVTGSSSIGREASKLTALAHPFKLRLKRDQDNSSRKDQLRDYSSNVVLVEPLSTIEVIEDFLWSKVSPVLSPPASSTPHFGGRKSSSMKGKEEKKRDGGSSSSVMTRSMAAASSSLAAQASAEDKKGKGKSSEGGSTSAVCKRNTRSSSRLKAAAEAERKHTSDEQMEERNHEEEDEQMGLHDYGDEEEDDAMMEDEMDMDMDEDEDLDLDDEEEDDMFDDSGFRFRRESEVFEVEVGDEDNRSAASTPSSSSKKPHSTTGASSAGYAGKASVKKRRLQFMMDGRILDPSTTIFQAVLLQESGSLVRADDQQEAATGSAADFRPGYHIWEKIHTLSYKALPAATKTSASTGSDSKSMESSKSLLGSKKIADVEELVGEKVSQALISVEHMNSDIASILKLIDLLVWLHSGHAQEQHPHQGFQLSTVPQEEFVSARLASKVMRQLQDPLIVCGSALPKWLHKLLEAFPFTFPFDLRRQYLHSGLLGAHHAMRHLLQQSMASGDESILQELRDIRVVRNRRQKVRISREKLLESASKVMELYAKASSSLEIEYFGEVGTGLGPTLEFYTLLSSELQKRERGMWLTKAADTTITRDEGMRNADEDITSDPGLIFGDMDSVPKTPAPPGEQTVHQEQQPQVAQKDLVLPPGDGLFPIPIHPGSAADDARVRNVLRHFKLLGRSVAKVVRDGRLMDMSLSTAFWRRASGKSLTIYDLASVDPDMSKSLVKLHSALCSCGANSMVVMDGVAIEDLGLYFTLPGDDDYELCENGGEVPVTGSNLHQFLDAVLDAYFGRGTEHQFIMFREGFEEVFPLEALNIFNPEEIDTLVCGQTERWTVEMLSECLKFDHGYTASSPFMTQFLHILAEFNPQEQRQFLKFVTGCPRLPPGGLSALNPRFTIVRKNFSSARGDNNGTPPSASVHTPMNELALENLDLPSVMTCANYLKLPPYTSKAVMKEKLLYAMNEGQHSFNLS